MTATWPFTPLGTKITIEVPNTYELDDVGRSLNELVTELRKKTPCGRFVQLIVLPILRTLRIVK